MQAFSRKEKKCCRIYFLRGSGTNCGWPELFVRGDLLENIRRVNLKTTAVNLKFMQLCFISPIYLQWGEDDDNVCLSFCKASFFTWEFLSSSVDDWSQPRQDASTDSSVQPQTDARRDQPSKTAEGKNPTYNFIHLGPGFKLDYLQVGTETRGGYTLLSVRVHPTDKSAHFRVVKLTLSQILLLTALVNRKPAEERTRGIRKFLPARPNKVP